MPPWLSLTDVLSLYLTVLRKYVKILDYFRLGVLGRDDRPPKPSRWVVVHMCQMQVRLVVQRKPPGCKG